MATNKERAYVTAGIANPEVAKKILEIIDWYEAGGGGGGAVTSVNGEQGVVVLTSDDISEGVTNKYYTDARAKAATVVDNTLGNQTDKAASVAAMKSYVASSSPDLSNYYDKTETDSLLDDKADQVDLTQEIQDRIDADSLLIPLTQKGANNGVATLDGGGKVPVSQLPNSVMTYEGTYNATTNSPTLIDGTGNAGSVYIVSVAGSQDFGSGSISFEIGDWVVYSGSIWEKSSNSNSVVSVNSQTGAVVLDTDDISEGANKYYATSLFNTDFAAKDTDDLDEGSTNLYFTNTRAQSALSSTISDINSDIAQEIQDRIDADVVLQDNIDNEVTARGIAVTGVQSNLDTHITNNTGAHTATAISNTPFGNLAATHVQGALNELQIDIDSRALNSALTSHINEINDAHAGSAIGFDNTYSGLSAINIQDAIDELNDNAAPVTSVNTQTGAVVLDTDDISEGSTNVYFTNDRVLEALSLYTTFALSNNQSSPANITDLIFDNSISGFELFATVQISADVNISEVFNLIGINIGANWEIYPIATGSGSSNVVFSITSLGQIQYTTPNYAGFIGASLRYRPISSSAASVSGVSSVNGYTGVVSLSKTDLNLDQVDNTSDLNKVVSTATQSALDLKQDIITGNSNSVAGFDNSGELQSIQGFQINSNGGLSESITFEPNDNGYISLNNFNINVTPLQDSPDESVTVNGNSLQLDQLSSGFNLGINGNAVTVINNQVNHSGTGDVGDIAFTSNNFNLGNGVDAIDVKGVSYSYGFGTVNANVNISGPIQGYGFQPNINAASTVGPSSYVNAFYDYSNISTNINSYQSYATGPTIAGINNNFNLSSFNANPNVTEFFGNSSYNGLNLTGNFGTFNTGNYTGIYINPIITTGGDNSTGIRIDMSNVSASNVRAMDIKGDVNIDGDLSFTGGLSIGQLNAFYELNPVVDGGGNTSNVHGLISGVRAPDSVTTANCDTIGVNTAMLITLEEDSVCTSGAFGLGLTALALPCVVETHTNSTLDFMSGATFALNFSGSSTGGTINQAYGGRAVAIPNGITTLNRYYGWFAHLPFGDPATNSWGIYIKDHSKNYIESPLVIGVSDSPSNSSVGLELNNVTKAILNSRMTTSERNALTPLDGMQIYNTSNNRMEFYENGGWVYFTSLPA